MTDATAILYDAADAERFLAERPPVARVLALTPNARAILAPCELPFLSSVERYSPYSHRRSLSRVRKAKPAFLDAAASNGLSPAVSETLRGVFEMAGSMVARAYASLGDGPWLFPGKTGWCRINDRAAAHAAMIGRVAANPSWLPYRPARFGYLLSIVNQAATAIIAPRRALLFCNADKGFADVIAGLLEQDQRAVAVNLQPATGSWRDLARSCRGLWHLLTGRRNIKLTVSPDAVDPAIRNKAQTGFEAVTDPVLRRGFDLLEESLICRAAEAAALIAPLTSMISGMKPRALITYSLRWRFEAALGEAAGRAGVPRFLVSHGSHAIPEGASSAAALDGHAEGLLVSTMADVVFTQSPQADEAAQRLMPWLPREPIRPAVWGHRLIVRNPVPAFRVLHAGTLKSWPDHRPWMYETSDEFVDGLIALARTFQELGPQYELVIRVRAADECSLEALQKLVPAAKNVRIKSTGKFLDDLAEADLLVSYSSTTIEEALTARRPVLLFGGGCPYRHFPARSIPPTATDRAPVYAVDDTASLAPMIAAIRGVHRDELLTDAELAGYSWPENTTNLTEYLAAFLLTVRDTPESELQRRSPEKQDG